MDNLIDMDPGESLTFLNEGLKTYHYHMDTFIPLHLSPPISASLAHDIISTSPRRAIVGYQQKLSELGPGKIPSETLIHGCIGHSVLFRESEWEKNIVYIEGDYRNKGNKTIGLQALADGYFPVKSNLWQKLLEMNTAIESTELAQRVLVGGDSEVSVFWKDEEFPRLINKARIDFVPDEEGIKANQWVIDYKTCKSLAGWGVSYFWNYGLAVKFAHYVDAVRAMYPGTERVGIAYLCQEKEPPYDVKVSLAVANGHKDDDYKEIIKLPPEAYEKNINVGNFLYSIGKKRLDWVKETWTQCLNTGEYPAHLEVEFLNVGKLVDNWRPPELSKKIKTIYRRSS